MLTGNLDKMLTKLGPPAQYELWLSGQTLLLNPLIGKQLVLKFTGEINCGHCGRATKKSYNDGYCFPCTQKLAECDICIVKPELCHFHLGTCRDPEWGQKHCMAPHIVYLANSSGAKVGITREKQVPTRWIDQGAKEALPIMRVGSRYQSGQAEVLLAKSVADKTNWRTMLAGEVPSIDLASLRDRLFASIGDELELLEESLGDDLEFLDDAETVSIDYPVNEYPKKIVSLSFDKTPEIKGVLQGIKGQYLIFDHGVINIRRHSGYKISVETPD
jgi:hypothetical protein